MYDEYCHFNKISSKWRYFRFRGSKVIDQVSGNQYINRHPQPLSWDPLQWRHNGHDVVSNHQPHDCLLNRLFGRRSKKTSKVCVTGLSAGNSPVTSEFPAQMASNAEIVPIWWRHHDHLNTCSFKPNARCFLSFLTLLHLLSWNEPKCASCLVESRVINIA